MCITKIIQKLMEDKLDECIEVQIEKIPNNVLLIKTAKDEAFIAALNKLKDSCGQLKLSVLCKSEDARLLDSLGISCVNLFYHENKIDSSKAFEYIDSKYIQDIEAIVFINYHEHSESYLNVEELCYQLRRKKNIPCYSFNGVSKGFVLYKDILEHIVLLRTYCFMQDTLYNYIIDK